MAGDSTTKVQYVVFCTIAEHGMHVGKGATEKAAKEKAEQLAEKCGGIHTPAGGKSS